MNSKFQKERRQFHKIRSKILKMAFLFCGMISIFFLIQTGQNAKAEDKKYGIMIADGNGNDTFFDWNDSSTGKPVIETSDNGTIMVPLKNLCSLMPVLVYHFDSKKKTTEVSNTVNKHKIIFIQNSKKFTYYSSSKTKAVRKNMEYQMYQSNQSNSLMVPMSVLKWVMGTTSGYHYFNQTNMLGLGYDTVIFNGIIAYHPYKAVSVLPKATQVYGISNTVKVTIPEGYSVPQVFDLLVKKGICNSTSALYTSMEQYDFSYYPLVADLKENQNRCYKLEGYLYPDTYNFYILSKSQDVIGKFLRNAETKLSKDDRNKAKSLGYSVNDVLSIASLIEKETPDKAMMPQIASVIYNRLKIGMKLQFDSSIYYVERYIKPNISGDINRYNAYYNTYKTPALPAGPICNPGKAAINAALNPAVTDYLYFYSDADGQYHFSKEYVNAKTIENESSDSTKQEK